MKGLLDTIQLTAHCGYLSDLHKDINVNKVKDAVVLISPQEYSLNEWNEAVSYITKETCECKDVYTAKEILIGRLSN